MPVQAKKLATIFGATGKLEASYGAGGALSITTDGILIYEPALLTQEYINTGERPVGIGRGGPMKKVAAKGRGGSVELLVEGLGLGSAYSAIAFPPNGLHTLLRMAGLAATFSAAPTPQWAYTPDVVQPAQPSGVMDLYAHGMKWPYTGVVSNFGFTIGEASTMRFRFPTFGLPGDPVEQATVPQIVASTLVPPTATGIALTVGAFNIPVVRSIEFDMGREISGNRLDHVATEGSAGYVAGGRNGVLTIVAETPELAATGTPTATQLDPFKMFRDGVHIAISFTVGAVQYNRIKFTALQAALNAVPTIAADGPVSTITLSFVCAQSSFGTNDDFELLLN